MNLRNILWWHFAIVILFAAVAYLDSGRRAWYGTNLWLTEVTELQFFQLFVGILAIVAIMSLFLCPIAVLVISLKSKVSAGRKAAAIAAEMLLVTGQVIAIIPTVQ